MNSFKITSFVKDYLKNHIWIFIGLILSIILAAFSGLLPSYVLKYIIDDYATVAINTNTIDSAKLIYLAILYFGSYLLYFLFIIFENYMISLFGQQLIHKLRYEMLEKVQKLPSSYFTSHGTGEMSSQIMDDVHSIETLFATGLISILVSLLKIIGILISILVFSWILGLIIIAIVPLIFVITLLFRKIMLKNHIKNRKIINQQANHISETINTILTTQNLDKEEYKEKKFRELLNEGYDAKLKTGLLDSIYSPIIECIKTLVIALVTILVAYGVSSSNYILGISLGTFAASINLITDIFSPIQNLGQELEAMQEGLSGVKRIQVFMNEKEINKKEEAFTYKEIFKRNLENIVEIDNVSFKYDDGDKYVLSNLNFVVKNEEKVILTGRTGVGKTTLFKLILGINKPSIGKVIVNGYDIYEVPDLEKRKIFGYVEQGFSAINGDIKSQITLNEDISLDEVREVMKQVNLDSYVMNHIKDNYNATFKESDFSRGQLQLLSLARALLFKPKILLLDEISANLDSKTESDIIKALSSASNHKTVISISHRLSDQLGFDRVIEIK